MEVRIVVTATFAAPAVPAFVLAGCGSGTDPAPRQPQASDDRRVA